MRKAFAWSLGLGLLMIAVAAYPVVAQSQGQRTQPGQQPGQMGQQPGHMGQQPGHMGQSGQSTGKPLFNANDFRQLEQQGMISLTQVIQSAEAQGKGKAVAVIPVRDQGNVEFKVYTTQDGQLICSTVDAKTGRLGESRPTNTIAELSASRYAGFEEQGGQPQQQPQRGGREPGGRDPSRP